MTVTCSNTPFQAEKLHAEGICNGVKQFVIFLSDNPIELGQIFNKVQKMQVIGCESKCESDLALCWGHSNMTSGESESKGERGHGF